MLIESFIEIQVINIQCLFCVSASRVQSNSSQQRIQWQLALGWMHRGKASIVNTQKRFAARRNHSHCIFFSFLILCRLSELPQMSISLSRCKIDWTFFIHCESDSLKLMGLNCIKHFFLQDECIIITGVQRGFWIICILNFTFY